MTISNVHAPTGADTRKTRASVSYPSAGSSMTGSAGVSSAEVDEFADWLAQRKLSVKTKAKTGS